MDNDYYLITNFDKFSKALRFEAAKILYEDIKEEHLDNYITIKQCCSIIKTISKKIHDEYYLDEDTYIQVIEEISSQIHQSALSKLASDDIIQCAWDEEKDGMVFWVDNNKNL